MRTEPTEAEWLRAQLDAANAIHRNDAEELTEYRDALIKLDELSLMLGQTLQFTRIGWDDDVTCDGVLTPINQIAKQIGDAMPPSIVATRPPRTPADWTASHD